MSTVAIFKEIARKEAYYTVMSQWKFRKKSLTDAHKREFFNSGRRVANHICNLLGKNLFDSCMDFGCGVGRLLQSFPARIKVGVDISFDMLSECAKNVPNVRLVSTDEIVRGLWAYKPEVLYSAITFQHIRREEGYKTFEHLLELKPKYYCIEFCIKDKRSKLIKLLWKLSFVPFFAGLSNILRFRRWSEPRIPMFIYYPVDIVHIIVEHDYTCNTYKSLGKDGFVRCWFYGVKK